MKVQLVDLINKDNEVIDTKLRSQLNPSDMIRFVHVYIFDAQGHFVVQQRCEKQSRPNLLDCSAGGHVDAGESFEDAAYRELKEELGIETPLDYVCDSWGKYGLCKVYKGVYHDDFKPCNIEIENIDTFHLFELFSWLRRRPYLFNRGFRDSLKCYSETIFAPLSLVNEHDEVVGSIDYDTMSKNRLSVRVVQVYVKNSKGEFLYQRRSGYVAEPYQLDEAATGHVDYGESYKEAAERELFEELNIIADFSKVEPIYHGKLESSGKFSQSFVIEYDGPVIFNEDEVSNIVWLKPENIHSMMKTVPFLFTKTSQELYRKSYNDLFEK